MEIERQIHGITVSENNLHGMKWM